MLNHVSYSYIICSYANRPLKRPQEYIYVCIYLINWPFSALKATVHSLTKPPPSPHLQTYPVYIYIANMYVYV